MTRGRSPSPDGGRANARTERAQVAHALRTSLGALRSWAEVLEIRLADSADPLVRRALEGLGIAIAQQVAIIENQLEGDAVQSPLRRAAMGKRNDAQPDEPEREKRSEPSTMSPESPAGPRTSKAEEEEKDQVTRRGEG